MKRLYNLDYLRGLAAFGIMIYHYTAALYGAHSAATFLGRLGMYGVSIFYILSGLTLYLVYHSKMTGSKNDILAFAKKRFFRIYPLLWLATISSIIISKTSPDILRLILNLTGLFGFIKWDASMAIGTWSIGNELVFYAFFPVFIILMNKSKAGLAVLSFIIAGVYLYFAFCIIDPNKTLAEQWNNYINPLNQLFLFLGGFLTGMIFKNINISTTINLAILCCGLGLFIFYPASGDKIAILTGFNRIIFTVSSFLICLGFFKTTIKFPHIIHKPLTWPGEASYSVYLLHMLVYFVLTFFFKLSATHFFDFPVLFKLAANIIVTLFLSYFVYQKFEKYFMKLGQPKKTGTPQSTVPVGVNDTR
ncbi:MAG: acyltransferase [Ferruginibacter sp.]